MCTLTRVYLLSLTLSLILSLSRTSLILHLMGEACLKEDTLMRVLVIGLKRELPLSPADSLDIADRLVARTASAHTDGNSHTPSLLPLSFPPSLLLSFSPSLPPSPYYSLSRYPSTACSREKGALHGYI